MTLHPLRALLATLLATGLLLPGCGGGGGGDGPGGGDNPPTVVLTSPTGPVAAIQTAGLPVVYTASDDGAATVRLVIDADGNPATTGDQTLLFQEVDRNGAPTAITAPTAGLAPLVGKLFVIVNDGVHAPVSSGGPAVMVYATRAGVAPVRSNRYGVIGQSIFFSVGEAEDGGAVLNADGLADDGVIAELDMSTGAWTQTVFDTDVTNVAGGTAQVMEGSVAGAVTWPRREADRGANLNAGVGDVDQADTYAAAKGPGAAAFMNPVAGATIYGASGAGRRIVRFQESAQGPPPTGDLNGDGDALDEVFAALDLGTNQLAIWPFATTTTSPFPYSGAFGAYLFSEAGQGVDATGNGLTTETVIFVVNMQAPVGPANFPVARAGFVAGTQLPRAVSPGGAFDVNSTPWVCYYVDEAGSSAVPLNGDADTTDFIPAIYDATTFFEYLPALGSSLNAGPNPRYMFFDGPMVLFHAREEGADRNGDGDGTDLEVLWWTDTSLAPGAAVPLAPTGIGTLTGIALDGGQAAQVSPGWVSLVVSEQQNGTIMNGDGDVSDLVLLLVNLSTSPPTVINTGLVPASGGTIPLTGVGGPNGLIVRLQEVSNGNLNGDGDATDDLLFFIPWAAPATKVNLANTGGLHAAERGGVVGITANEQFTGVDYNGDSDALDIVFRAVSITGTVLEPGIPSRSQSVPTSDTGSTWAFIRDEVQAAVDLNGDGDMLDGVLGVWLH